MQTTHFDWQSIQKFASLHNIKWWRIQWIQTEYLQLQIFCLCNNFPMKTKGFWCGAQFSGISHRMSKYLSFNGKICSLKIHSLEFAAWIISPLTISHLKCWMRSAFSTQNNRFTPQIIVYVLWSSSNALQIPIIFELFFLPIERCETFSTCVRFMLFHQKF